MSDKTSQYVGVLNEVSSPPFVLQDVEGFPVSEYSRLLTKYTEAGNWYSGTALDETKVRDGKTVEIYPVKINPIKAGVQKHTFALFGEVEEDDRPMVSPKVVFHDDAQKKLAEEAEDALLQMWFESNGRAIQWENGALSQVYGGCVFKLDYDPNDPLSNSPVKVSNPHPKYFVGRPDSSDMFRLREAWIVRPISLEEAIENGYSPTNDPLGEDQVPWLIEHWTNSEYKAQVNDQPVKRQTADGEWRGVSGANPYGFVPVQYIPHIRVEGFYGENFFDVVKGVIKELNLRVADYGDAVNVDSHSYMGMKHVTGAADVVRLAPGLNAINLPSMPGITGNEASPDLWELRKASASEAMGKLTEALYDQYRRDAFVPKVSDGEDEGSQRSGLTLAMRMLSLLWHTQSERVFWTAALNNINRMALRMLAIKEPRKTGITIKHATLRIKQDWSPVLPRDREMLVNEVVARAGVKLGSPETLLEILGDVQDVDDEIKRIIEFAKLVAKAESSGVQPAQTGRKQVSPSSPTSGQSSKPNE
jgi:hypothetical protein